MLFTTSNQVDERGKIYRTTKFCEHFRLQLFDFDLEVKPILEVLVGKTVEQSLLEVMEEEELANLRSQQREFEELRNAELVEQQRLEEQERRRREEKVIQQDGLD